MQSQRQANVLALNEETRDAIAVRAQRTPNLLSKYTVVC